MADTEQQEKRLPPTERRLQEAREEGRVPRSRHLASFLMLGGAMGAMIAFAPHMIQESLRLFGDGLQFAAKDAHDPAALSRRFLGATMQGLWLAAPIGVLLMALGIAAPLATGGWVFTAKPLTPDFSRLDPLSGLGRMFSLNAWIELAKTLALAVSLGALVAWTLWHFRETFQSLAMLPLPAALSTASGAVSQSLLALLGAFAAVAIADVVHERWRYMKQLRMTPEEVKRESRETEGDPQIKSRVRNLQREMAKRRMMAAVPTSDVVITNPTHFAVALRYSEADMGAPRVVAKGAGAVAVRIREIAVENGVLLLEAPPLARALYAHAEIDTEIPVTLFQAVAQVLAYVFQLRRYHAGQAPRPVEPKNIEVPPGLDPASVNPAE
jgi:flagellar biosynthetic protein FlhB